MSKQKNKTRRRGRKTNIKNGTLYECPCGRIYTSYPALYTHIKQNHQGEAPGLIKMPENIKKRIGASKIEEHNKKKLIYRNSQQPLNLQQIFSPLMVQIKPPLPSQITQIIQKSVAYKLILAQNKPFIPVFNDADSIYDIKICQGVSILFLDIQPVLSKDMYNISRFVMVQLLQYMVQDAQDQSIIVNGSLGLTIDYTNYFIVTSLSQRINKYKLQNSWLGSKQNIITVFNCIFQWMLYKGYTLITTKVNNKYSPAKDQMFSSLRQTLFIPGQNSDQEDDKNYQKLQKKIRKVRTQTLKYQNHASQFNDESSQKGHKSQNK